MTEIRNHATTVALTITGGASNRAKERAVDKIVPAEKAKQGRRGTHLLAILLIGLVLVAAVWLVVEYAVAT